MHAISSPLNALFGLDELQNVAPNRSINFG